MYTDSFYNPFDDFFGQQPRYSQRQPPRQQRRYQNNFDPYFPFGEQRQVPPQRKYHKQPQRTNNPRTSPPQKDSQLSPRALKVLNEKVTLIQSAFRAYSVQKKNILPNLRRLKEVEDKVNRAYEKFNNVISLNPDLKGEKLRMTYAEYEENLTKALLELDSVVTRGVDVVREARKDIVTAINSELSMVDSKKPEIQESVRQEKEVLEQLRLQKEAEEAERIRLEEEEKAQLETEQSESESASESDSAVDWQLFDESEDSGEFQDIPMSEDDGSPINPEVAERLQHRLELIRQEEERLMREKEDIDQLLAQWTEKKAKLEDMKTSLLESDSMEL